MAPATAAVTSQESATTGVATSLGVTHPTGLADGDTVIIVAAAVRDGGGTVTWTGPSGFSQVGSDQELSSGTIELTVWAKDITSAASEPTWTLSVSYGGTPSAANLVAIADRITGAEAAANVTAAFTITNTGTSSHVAPSISITDSNTLVLAGAVAQRPGTWTSPSGYTELADIFTSGNSGFQECALCLADSDSLIASGTESPGTFTYSQSRQGVSYSIAVGPAASSEAYTGTVTGATTSSGTVVGSKGATGVVAGATSASGTVAGSKGATGTVSGSTTTAGTVVGSEGSYGVATGSTTTSGSAVGSLGYAGTVSGSTTTAGTVVGTSSERYGTVSGNTTTSGTVVGSGGDSTSFPGFGPPLPPKHKPQRRRSRRGRVGGHTFTAGQAVGTGRPADNESELVLLDLI